MKIVFVSNYFNHHQKAFSDAMFRCEKVQYNFIATTKMRNERKKLGYSEDELPDYVLCTYWGEEIKDIAQSMINTADIVIAGSAPEKMFRQRIRNGMLVFRYSERPLKADIGFQKYIKYFIKFHIKNPCFKSIYLLCASAYTYSDYRKFYLFKNKAFKWGYFPKTYHYKDIDSLIKQKNKNVILWCGRFIEWKHPEYMIEVAKRLIEDKIDFEIQYIGTGEKEDYLLDEVKKYNLESKVKFLGAVPAEKVREYMERASVLLFTSDKQEGWGAVLNEAMNSACAVVASNMAGATPYLVNNGKNGLIFEAENIDMLYDNVKILLTNCEECERMGKEAYYTIVNEWNAEIAAKRLVEILERILAGKNALELYEHGPCSRADMK